MLAKFKLEEREPIRATFSINKVVSAEKVEKALAEEIERATSVEDQLREDLIAETERATASEESLQENINSEKIRAESVEADISTNLLAEKERAESVEADISGTLAAEVNRLDLEDGRLNNQIQVAFETIEENKEKVETAINGLSQDIETLDSKVDQNITNIKDNVDALTGEVENIAGELDGKQPLGDYALKSDVPTKVSEIENDSKYTTETEVAQMIASIPQFEVKIVQELPLTGESMILYMVPKIGTTGDVYDEFIWIESENKFELVGSTTVDLSDYVKNTDYAKSSTAGVIKTAVTAGSNVDNNGVLQGVIRTQQQYNTDANVMLLSKGTIENIKETLVTSVGDNKYQTIINDLETIRVGAKLGETALQSYSETDPVYSADKPNIATKSELPTLARANVPGLVAGGNWLTVNQTTGKMECGELTKTQYDVALGYTFISKTTLENVLNGRTIITKSNNQSGNIKYSDGRMEQWGLATTSNTGETEFTMSASFIDTNYQVFIEPRQAGDLVHYAIPSAVNKFKTRIQNTSGAYMACQFQWRAYGFWK